MKKNITAPAYAEGLIPLLGAVDAHSLPGGLAFLAEFKP